MHLHGSDEEHILSTLEDECEGFNPVRKNTFPRWEGEGLVSDSQSSRLLTLMGITGK